MALLPARGVVFVALLVGGSIVVNLLLLGLGPLGWALEIALWIWTCWLDNVAFNGQGRPWRAFRRGWWWEDVRRYFPLSLHQDQEFDAAKRYVFVVHPHGVIGISAWLTFAADTAGLSRKNRDLDVALATIRSNFFLPFWRDVLLAAGFIDASFRSLAAALRRNRSIAVVLGGAAEALDARPGTNNIILKKRTGIFRLALHTGTPLVPVFVFGESDLYYQASNCKGSLLRRVQELFLSKFKFAPPLVWGTGILGCPVGVCPRAVPLHVVTGAPIPVPLVDDPSEADVAKYQELYQSELVKLYAEHEQQYYEEIVPKHLRPQVRPVLRVVA